MKTPDISAAHITQEKVRSLLYLNDSTGEFFWAAARSNRHPKDAKAGSVTSQGYVRINLLKRPVLAHRLAWLYVYGKWPDGELDHINGDPADNRICNLREVSHAKNMQNIHKKSNTVSGIKGVSLFRGLQWKAQITHQYKATHLGYFATKEEAALAYAKAATVMHTHNNVRSES